MTLVGTRMVSDGKTARQLFEEVMANPARRKFGFGSKLAVVNVDFQQAYTAIDSYATAYETDPRQIEYTNTIDGNFGGYAELRNNFSIQAGMDDWNVTYFNRYIGESEYLADGSKIDSVLYHNISASYFITDGLSVSLGVKNLTDEEPSRVANGSDGGTVPEVFDTIGRQFFGGISYKF